MQQVLRTLTDFERDGFAVFRAVVSAQQIELLTDTVEKARTEQAAPGLRNLLNRCSTLKAFANSSGS